MAGSAIRAMEEYNLRVSRNLRARQIELQSIVAMLTESLTCIASASERSASRLHNIEKQLERASDIEDVRALKLRLAECLEELRDERNRQQEENHKHVAGLTSGLERSRRALTTTREHGTGLDPLTGLPERGEAERIMIEAMAEGRSVFAAIFVVDRVASINTRYGYAAGDQVILMMCQRLAQGFSVSDVLFRWTGPAFLLLLEREEAAIQVRSELARAVGMRMEKTLQIGGRTVLLPVTATWAVFPLSEERSVEQLIHKIDSFVAGRVSVK